MHNISIWMQCACILKWKPALAVQARSNKAAFSFLKDTEKVVDLGNGLEMHVERINSNIGRLFFAAAKQMPGIIVREPNAER